MAAIGINQLAITAVIIDLEPILHLFADSRHQKRLLDPWSFFAFFEGLVAQNLILILSHQNLEPVAIFAVSPLSPEHQL